MSICVGLLEGLCTRKLAQARRARSVSVRVGTHRSPDRAPAIVASSNARSPRRSCGARWACFPRSEWPDGSLHFTVDGAPMGGCVWRALARRRAGRRSRAARLARLGRERRSRSSPRDSRAAGSRAAGYASDAPKTQNRGRSRARRSRARVPTPPRSGVKDSQFPCFSAIDATELQKLPRSQPRNASVVP